MSLRQEHLDTLFKAHQETILKINDNLKILISNFSSNNKIKKVKYDFINPNIMLGFFMDDGEEIEIPFWEFVENVHENEVGLLDENGEYIVIGFDKYNKDELEDIVMVFEMVNESQDKRVKDFLKKTLTSNAPKQQRKTKNNNI